MSQLGQKATSPGIEAASAYPRKQTSSDRCGLQQFARLQGGLASRNPALSPQMQTDCATPCVVDSAIYMRGWHRPEMAHFFAQNIIAPGELFSEN
jgi:hypothetical protein